MPSSTPPMPRCWAAAAWMAPSIASPAWLPYRRGQIHAGLRPAGRVDLSHRRTGLARRPPRGGHPALELLPPLPRPRPRPSLPQSRLSRHLDRHLWLSQSARREARRRRRSPLDRARSGLARRGPLLLLQRIRRGTLQRFRHRRGITSKPVLPDGPPARGAVTS